MPPFFGLRLPLNRRAAKAKYPACLTIFSALKNFRNKEAPAAVSSPKSFAKKGSPK